MKAKTKQTQELLYWKIWELGYFYIFKIKANKGVKEAW